MERLEESVDVEEYLWGEEGGCRLSGWGRGGTFRALLEWCLHYDFEGCLCEGLYLAFVGMKDLHYGTT